MLTVFVSSLQGLSVGVCSGATPWGIGCLTGARNAGCCNASHAVGRSAGSTAKSMATNCVRSTGTLSHTPPVIARDSPLLIEAKISGTVSPVKGYVPEMKA